MRLKDTIESYNYCDIYNTDTIEYTVEKMGDVGVVVHIGELTIDLLDIQQILDDMRYMQKRVDC